jgi:quinol monooxygenase YgiN
MKSIRRILLSALLLLGVPYGAQGQNAAEPSLPPKNAAFVVTYIDVALAAAPRAIGLLQQYRDALAAAGNSSVELYQRLGQPDQFVIAEQWPDRATFDVQKTGQAATQLFARLKDMESEPPDSHVFQGYAIGPVRAPTGGRARVWRVSHFEIAAARLAEFDTLAKPFVEASRNDPGLIRFDILQESNPRQNQFAIIEGWSSPQAAEAHRISAHAEKFREGLAPMQVAPFDDRLYGKFN